MIYISWSDLPSVSEIWDHPHGMLYQSINRIASSQTTHPSVGDDISFIHNYLKPDANEICKLLQ